MQNLRNKHPDADEPREALLARWVNAAITRLPLQTDGLRVTVLCDEPKMVRVPVGHRLAGMESVTLDDIEGEPIPRFRDPEWDAYWRIDSRPSGRLALGGPPVETIEDGLAYVAARSAVAVIPAALHTGGTRADITVPLHGVEPGHVVVATRAADRSRLETECRTSARDHLSG